MIKKDKLFLNEIFGDNSKFIEISFREYPDEGLFIEIENKQKYFRFDSSLINGYYPVGVINAEYPQSQCIKLIRNVFPTFEKMFVFTDSLTSVSTEDVEKRKWTKIGDKFYGCDIYDFNCVYITRVPKGFSFKKIDDTRIDIPEDISLISCCTGEKIKQCTISILK